MWLAFCTNPVSLAFRPTEADPTQLAGFCNATVRMAPLECHRNATVAGCCRRLSYVLKIVAVVYSRRLRTSKEQEQMAENSPKKWLNLEEHFFAQMDQRLLEKLRKEQSTTETAESIMKITGITDPKVAAELASIGVTIETLTAFRLVPLVAVAWADDRLEENERDAILQAAEKSGITPEEPAMAMLRLWTNKRPGAELMEAWCHYTKSLSGSLNEANRAVFRKEVIEQVQAVARSAGGLLGIASISASEKAVIDRVERALA